MATSGSCSTGSYKGRYLTFNWWINSQSTANNTTTIGWSLDGDGDSGYVVCADFYVKIDGDVVYNKDSSYQVKVYNTTTIASGTKTITHNADGTRSFSVYIEAGIYNWDANKSGSGSWSLTSIPRGASLTGADNFYDDANPQISYSNPAGSAVTSLQACIASTDGSTVHVPYRDISKSGTSYTFNLTDDERNTLRNLTPNSDTLALKFYVKTVISGNTFYSSLQRNMKISPVYPTATVEFNIADDKTAYLTNDNKTIISGITDLTWSIEGATAYKGASIKGYAVTNGTFTSDKATGTITDSTNATFTARITDSRGFYTDYVSNGTLVEYFVPTIKGNIGNPNTNGEMLYRVSGIFFNGKFGSASGAKSNDFTCYYRFNENDGEFSDWIAIPMEDVTVEGNNYSIRHKITGLDYRNSYGFQARFEDQIHNVMTSNTKTVSSIPVYDWSYKDFNFNVPVNFSGGIDTNELKITSPVAGLTNRSYGVNKILATTASYMTASQTVNLSEAVSAQPNGIVLAWSSYTDGTAHDYDWAYQFIPKQHVLSYEGAGIGFPLITTGFGYVASKYVYVSDTKITGYSGNTNASTGSSINFDNSYWVLRYVVGV